MQRFRAALQFFGGAGYVVLMVDHRIITTFRIWFHSAGRFSCLEGLSQFSFGKCCRYWWIVGLVHLFAFGKKLNLVAGGGIEPPTRGFSI